MDGSAGNQLHCTNGIICINGLTFGFNSSKFWIQSSSRQSSLILLPLTHALRFYYFMVTVAIEQKVDEGYQKIMVPGMCQIKPEANTFNFITFLSRVTRKEVDTSRTGLKVVFNSAVKWSYRDFLRCFLRRQKILPPSGVYMLSYGELLAYVLLATPTHPFLKTLLTLLQQNVSISSVFIFIFYWFGDCIGFCSSFSLRYLSFVLHFCQ